jgi:hypothetical protein
MREKWKKIVGYKKYYKVSNKGNIKSLNRKMDNKRGIWTKVGEPMKLMVSNGGYYKINLYKNGKMSTKLVHRLVAISFIKNPLEKREVNHIDGDKLNNNINNLEWVTPKENIAHAIKNGLSNKTKKVKWLSLNGTLLGVYGSLIEAEKITGVSRKGISETLCGRQKTSGGY